jgi:hypothetical protein
MLKKYQPGRTDLLINTDWGIPSDQLSREAAQSRGMKLFHERWVIQEEKKQLREEYGTYHSIRIIGYLLIVLTLSIFINIGEISKGGVISTSFAVIYGFVMLAAGIGLIKFRRFARNIAVFVFLSFLVLPFTPLLSDDKGAPLIVILGLTGLYYLLRKTARKIFSPLAESNPDDTKQRSPVVRKAIYAVLLLLSFFVIYTGYDMSQAKRMAAAACIRATQEMPLENFLSTFSEKDYKIIRRAEHIMIVPKRGMGRNHCTVSHDGQKITGAKTGVND